MLTFCLRVAPQQSSGSVQKKMGSSSGQHECVLSKFLFGFIFHSLKNLNLKSETEIHPNRSDFRLNIKPPLSRFCQPVTLQFCEDTGLITQLHVSKRVGKNLFPVSVKSLNGLKISEFIVVTCSLIKPLQCSK